jgi:hypothetical protein
MNGLYVKIRSLSFKLVRHMLYISLNDLNKKNKMKINIIKMFAKYLSITL